MPYLHCALLNNPFKANAYKFGSKVKKHFNVQPRNGDLCAVKASGAEEQCFKECFPLLLLLFLIMLYFMFPNAALQAVSSCNEHTGAQYTFPACAKGVNAHWQVVGVMDFKRCRSQEISVNKD